MKGEQEVAPTTIPDFLRWPLYERKWVCEVVRSGYHNGAHCRPSDPHGTDWGCSAQWVAQNLPDTPEARALVERIEWLRQEVM
jgi:hypothetical protein